MTYEPPNEPRWNPLEAVCAWAIPGLGHVLLGQWVRGLIIGITIMVLWTGGLLIAGVTCIDWRKPMPSWFVAQVLVGPTLVANFMTSTIAPASAPRPLPTDPVPAYIPSIGKVNEQGVLFTSLAGLLNLLAIIDVIYTEAKPKRDSGADDGKNDAPTAAQVPSAPSPAQEAN